MDRAGRAARQRRRRHLQRGVRRGHAGVVPLETSVEGDVSSTIDELIFRSSMCFINEEIAVPVSYVVAGTAGTSANGITTSITTTAAAAQCRRFIESTDAEVVFVDSIATACRRVAAGSVRLHRRAGIGQGRPLYSLATLRSVAEDHSGVTTRMALLSRTWPPRPATTAQCWWSRRSGTEPAFWPISWGASPPAGHRLDRDQFPPDPHPLRRILLPAHRAQPPQRHQVAGHHAIGGGIACRDQTPRVLPPDARYRHPAGGRVGASRISWLRHRG